jgi:hypothetical protein
MRKKHSILGQFSEISSDLIDVAFSIKVGICDSVLWTNRRSLLAMSVAGIPAKAIRTFLSVENVLRSSS